MGDVVKYAIQPVLDEIKEFVKEMHLTDVDDNFDAYMTDEDAHRALTLLIKLYRANEGGS